MDLNSQEFCLNVSITFSMTFAEKTLVRKIHHQATAKFHQLATEQERITIPIVHGDLTRLQPKVTSLTLSPVGEQGQCFYYKVTNIVSIGKKKQKTKTKHSPTDRELISRVHALL